jgi:2-polyprenyl-3-methyl-5-hydroxy-6-metoxy-1,4-benzoquinol methylase
VDRRELTSVLDNVFASLPREWTHKEGAQGYPAYLHYLGAVADAADEIRAARGGESDPLEFLDIGLSMGVMGSACSVMGMQVTGVDDQRNAKHPLFMAIRDKFGIAYADYDALTDELPFDDESFDIVNSNDLIEHIHGSPKRMLSECLRVLRPDGRLIVTTPNLSSLYNRVMLLAGGSVHHSIAGWFHGPEWLRPRFTGHVREYTAPELRYMLRESGFAGVRVRLFDPLYGSATEPPADAADYDYSRWFAYLKGTPFYDRRFHLRTAADAAFLAHRLLTLPFPRMRRELLAVARKP